MALNSNRREMENAKEDSDSVEILVVLGDDEEEREKGEETVYVTVPDKEIKDITVANQNGNSAQDVIKSEDISIETKRLSCEHCHEIFQTNMHLKKHIATKHNVRTSKTYSKVISKTRENYTPYICGICKEGYTLQSQLDKHMPKEHSERSLMCKACGKLFKSQELLKNHWKGHMSPYGCQICNTSYSQRSELDLHFRVYHPNKIGPKDIRTVPPNNHNSHKETIAQYNKIKPNCSPLESSVISTTVTLTNISTPTVKVEQAEPYSSHQECNDTEMSNEDEVSETKEIKIDVTRLKSEPLDADYPLMETIDLSEDVDKKCSTERAPEDEAAEEIKVILPDEHDLDKKPIILNNKIKSNCNPSIMTCALTNACTLTNPIKAEESHSSQEESNDSEVTVQDGIRLDTIYLKGEPYDSDDAFSETMDLTEDGDGWNFIRELADQNIDTEALFIPFPNKPKSELVVSKYRIPGTGKSIRMSLPKDSRACELCNNKPFSNQYFLKRHIVEVHMDFRPYRCPTCHRKFHSKAILKTHEALHRNHRPFVCQLCEKAYVCRSHLKKHLEETHGGEAISFCKVCFKVFSVPDDLEKHMVLHASKDESSDESSQPETSVISTTAATNISTPVRPLEAVNRRSSQELSDPNDPLSEVVNSAEDAGVKMETRKGPESTETHLTPISIESKSDYVVLKHTIPGIAKPIKMKLPKGSTKCDMCGKTIASRGLLKRHIIAVHMNIRPFQCTICNKTFTAKTVLQAHLLRHNNDRFVCKVCGRSYICQSHLEQHMLVHGDEEVFTCEVCDRGFKRRDCLRQHVLVHDKKFACKVCDVSYATRYSLLRHMNTKHLGE